MGRSSWGKGESSNKGQGNREQGKGYGQKGRGKDSSKGKSAEQPVATRSYFSQPESDEDEQDLSPQSRPAQARSSGASYADTDKRKQEMKLRKKLREVEDLEKRKNAGEKLEALQLKKIDGKAAIEQELGLLTAVPKPFAASGLAAYEIDHSVNLSLDDVKKELEDLQQETQELEAQSRSWPQDAGKGKGKFGEGKGKFADRSVPAKSPTTSKAAPTVSMRVATVAKAEAPGAKAWGAPATKAWGPPCKKVDVAEGMQKDDECVPIPMHATDGQIESFKSDLEVWKNKFGLEASVDRRHVEIWRVDSGGTGRLSVSHGDPRIQAALSELKEIMRFNFGDCPDAKVDAPAACSREPLHRARSYDDLEDPDTVFAVCDTDESGELDLHELRFAFNAFGLFPDLQYIEQWMDGEPSLDKASFKSLLKQKLASAPSSMRAPRAIPYARRGVSLGQLEGLHEACFKSGWIQERCNRFNGENQHEINAQKVYRLDANLYALDKFVVRPVTSPDDYMSVPLHIRTEACLPPPQHKSSYSELANPKGVVIDYFVSHFWGHPFEDTMAALSKWSSQMYQKVYKKCPNDVVYWLCFLALNQHRAGEEVGSSPEDGPFNAALMQALGGAVMILDEGVNPFKRIWCLYEVKRLTELKKDFELVCSLGPVSRLLEQSQQGLANRAQVQETVKGIARALENVSAFAAMASSQDDKYAIWHRVSDPCLRRVPLHIARKRNLFHANVFKRFDMTIRSLLAAPLYQASLHDGDITEAFRYIGMGAAFNEQDLQWLQSSHGPDPCVAEVPVRSGDTTVQWKLLHCAAYFGHVDAVQCLLDRRADLEAKTSFGYTALHHAARNDHPHAVELLLRREADLETREKNGRTPIQSSAYQGHAKVLEVLARYGANLEAATMEGTTALHEAARQGHHDAVQVLLEFGANPEIETRLGMTPLHYGAQENHLEVVETIVAKAPRAVRHLSRKGTALKIAEKAGHEEVAHVLWRAASMQEAAVETAAP